MRVLLISFRRGIRLTSLLTQGILGGTFILALAGFVRIISTLLHVPPQLDFGAYYVAARLLNAHASLYRPSELDDAAHGYTLHRFSETRDLTSLVDVLNRSYTDRFGHKITTETDIQDWLVPETAANILLLRDAREALVGICRVRQANTAHTDQEHSIGYLDAPGVVPTHRQFGLYRSLVLAGMEHLRQQGQAEIVLESWGDEAHNIADYCDLGFTRQRHSIAYRRSVA